MDKISAATFRGFPPGAPRVRPRGSCGSSGNGCAGSARWPRRSLRWRTPAPAVPAVRASRVPRGWLPGGGFPRCNRGHSERSSSSPRGTPNCAARAGEQANRRWVRSQIRCTGCGLASTRRASAWSAAASRRAPSRRSRRARSSTSSAWVPDSQREMVDCATPSNSAACVCLTRCSRRQRRRAGPRDEEGRGSVMLGYAGEWTLKSAPDAGRRQIGATPGDPYGRRRTSEGRPRRAGSRGAAGGRLAQALAKEVGKGRLYRRCPVAAKIALASAGPMGATPGSPTPVGASPEGTMCTSTLGISAIRSTW